MKIFFLWILTPLKRKRRKQKNIGLRLVSKRDVMSVSVVIYPCI